MSTNQSPSPASVTLEQVALRRIATGCRKRYVGWSVGEEKTCLDLQKDAIDHPDAYGVELQKKFATGEHLCDGCIAASALFSPPSPSVPASAEQGAETQHAREFPACGGRVETESIQFGEDWPGTFIRGDDSMYLAMKIGEVILMANRGVPPSFITLSALRRFAYILGKCAVGGARDVPQPSQTRPPASPVASPAPLPVEESGDVKEWHDEPGTLWQYQGTDGEWWPNSVFFCTEEKDKNGDFVIVSDAGDLCCKFLESRPNSSMEYFNTADTEKLTRWRRVPSQPGESGEPLRVAQERIRILEGERNQLLDDVKNARELEAEQRKRADDLHDLGRRQQSEIEDLNCMADAVERLRDIGRVTGCDHVDDPDGRLSLVRCVETTIADLESSLAAQAADYSRQVGEARRKLEEIVCTKGQDRGVVLLSSESPTHTVAAPGRRSYEEYDHEHFSPLGDALIALHDSLLAAPAPAEGKGDGA